MVEVFALLQTDIVDSTRLNELLGDAQMSALWASHDRLSRDLLRTWRGQELDRTDGFLLQFASAADAVGFALDYHRALPDLRTGLLARAGIHVGPLTLRASTTGDIQLGAAPVVSEGLAIATTTRIMSLAKGGQTLLTPAAVSALKETTARVVPHGCWRFKGLEEPLEVYEIGDDEASFMPPVNTEKAHRVIRRADLWVPFAELRYNLPAEHDLFVGRKEPLSDLATRLDRGARLLCVLGSGGTGKTRLAQRFGWLRLGDFTGGVWFCDLSQAKTFDGLLQAIAQGLEVPLGRSNPLDQLSTAIIGHGPCLVILDNFEQVSKYAAQTVGHWLDKAPEARFIVTTREVLGISGEQAISLAPMTVPEAACLFLERAAAASSDFDPSNEDRASIDTLVELLDGLPLAIELAAARVRVMPPRLLVDRISERFALLSSRGGRPDRQSTLRRTLEWSWDLLTVAERTALAQLSTFEGGFSLRSAEAVVEIPLCEPAPWIVDIVQGLVEKSMVRRVSDHRFDLLSVVKEYARERLLAEDSFPGSGPGACNAAQARHWQYFAKLDESSAVAEKCIELDNLVAACRRSSERRDSAAIAGALAGAWAALKLSGPFRAAVSLARGIDRATLSLADQAQVDWVAGSALFAQGDVDEACKHFERGLAAARASGDRRCEANLLCALADHHSAEGHTERAREHLELAVRIADDFDDRRLKCKVLNGLGTLANDLGLLDEARNQYESALALARDMADQRWQGGLLNNLGILLHGQGQLELACADYEQSLIFANATGDRRWEGNTRCNLGLLHHEQGRPGDAARELQTALTIANEIGHVRLACTVLCNLGIVNEAQNRLHDAISNYEKAVATAHNLGDRRAEGQFRGYLGPVYAKTGRIDDARMCLALGEALLRAASDRLSLALLLCGRAEMEHLAGEIDEARSTLVTIDELIPQSQLDPNSELFRRLSAVRAVGR